MHSKGGWIPHELYLSGREEVFESVAFSPDENNFAWERNCKVEVAAATAIRE